MSVTEMWICPTRVASVAAMSTSSVHIIHLVNSSYHEGNGRVEVADRLHSIAIHLLRRVRTADVEMGLTPSAPRSSRCSSSAGRGRRPARRRRAGDAARDHAHRRPRGGRARAPWSQSPAIAALIQCARPRAAHGSCARAVDAGSRRSVALRRGHRHRARTLDRAADILAQALERPPAEGPTTLPTSCRASPPEPRRQHDEVGPDHRRHRPGRVVSGGAAAGEGLRGARDRAAVVELAYRAPRRHLPGSARREPEALPALRRPDDASSLVNLLREVQPAEIYNLGAQSHVKTGFETPEYTGDVTGLGAIRLLGRCARRSSRRAGLPGVDIRALRDLAAAAERGDAVPSPLAVRRRKALRLLGDRQLPRGVRHVRGERDPLQPRVSAARRRPS